MSLASRLWARVKPFHLDSLLFEVTSRCNLNCGHCYNIWKGDEGFPEKELSTVQTKAVIALAIKQTGCRQFTFTGGEPTMRADLEELAGFAAARCRHVAIITNGTRLEEARISALIRAGVGLFQLPLNAANRECHDELAGVPGSFDRVTRAAADIRCHGGNLAFVFVGTKRNMDQWKDVLELGIALGARRFLFNRYNAGGTGREHPAELMPSVEQIKQGLEVAEIYSAAYGIGVSAGIAIPPCLVDPRPYPHVGFGYCAAGTERAYYALDPLGNVRPCNHTSTVLGNIFNTSFKRLARSQQLKGFCEARPGFCLGCHLERDCQGGCKAAAQSCFGDLLACEPFLAFNKHLSSHVPGSPANSASSTLQAGN